jgi:glycosyltransferase involved in cell wall biosynthesis
MAKNIWMIAYTNYSIDARVRREAETIASLPEYRVHLLALKEMKEPRSYVLDGVEVHELNVAKYRGGGNFKYLSSYVRFLILAFLKCSGLSLKGAIDLIHVHNMPNFLVFAAILPRCFGKKIVLDVHDTLIETYSTKFSGIVSGLVKIALVLEEVVCCRLASNVICVNEMQRDALVDRGISKNKTIVLMNLPDPRKFELHRQESENPGNVNFKIVYFGTITHRLGVDLVLRALYEIRAAVSGLQFFIYGDGDGRKECLEICRELSLGDMVQFSETAVPLDELIQKVRDMDLVVVPNRRNVATDLMLPVKMLEGMALGIPVVAPRLRTIEHYFTADQVFYFESEDVQSLARAILSACQSRDGRKQKVENASRFFDKYSWTSQKQDLFNLYRELL